jgi:hypothetical protein
VVQDLRDLGEIAERTAVDKLRHAGQAVAGKLGGGRDQLTDCVRRYPIASMLVVAGLACCAGFLMRRRS